MNNEDLRKLAEKYPPPQEWFEEHICLETERTPVINDVEHNVEPKDS